MASFVLLPVQERAGYNLTKASPSRHPAHLLGDKLVHVLILRQEVVPVQPSTDPHGPNLFWSLREQEVNLFRWPLKFSVAELICTRMVAGGCGLTIPLQSNLRIFTSSTAAFPRGTRGLEISLQAEWTQLVV